MLKDWKLFLPPLNIKKEKERGKDDDKLENVVLIDILCVLHAHIFYIFFTNRLFIIQIKDLQRKLEKQIEKGTWEGISEEKTNKMFKEAGNQT